MIAIFNDLGFTQHHDFFFVMACICIRQKEELHVSSTFSSDRLHEQLNESDDAAQCYMLYIQDIFSCGVSFFKCSVNDTTDQKNYK